MVPLDSNANGKDVYGIRVIHAFGVDAVLTLMQSDGWDLVNLSVDGGYAVIPFKTETAQ